MFVVGMYRISEVPGAKIKPEEAVERSSGGKRGEGCT